MDQLTYGLLSITRKLGAHYIEKNGIIELLTDDAIAICLPFGNSQNDCIKLKYYNKSFYFSIIKIFSDEDGIGIIGAFKNLTELFTENFKMINTMFEVLGSKYDYTSDLKAKITTLQINEKLLKNIDNIESALISLLINKKVFILDDNLEIFSIIHSLVKILPESFHKLINLTIDSTSYTENVNLMSLPYSELKLIDLDNLKSEKSTIIDMENKTCFGIYSSPIFTYILQKVKEGQTEIVKEFFDFLEMLILKNNTLNVKITNNPKNFKLSKTDIKLFELIKYNMLNIPKKSNIFEELIK